MLTNAVAAQNLTFAFVGKVSTVNKTLCKNVIYSEKKSHWAPRNCSGNLGKPVSFWGLFRESAEGSLKNSLLCLPLLSYSKCPRGLLSKGSGDNKSCHKSRFTGQLEAACTAFCLAQSTQGCSKGPTGFYFQPFRPEWQVLCREEAMEEYKGAGGGGGRGWVLNLEEKALYSCPTALCVRSLKIASLS